MNLSQDEKRYLLKLARDTIKTYIFERKKLEIQKEEITGNLSLKCGVFVTLHLNGQLRGCIGRFVSDKPLPYVVSEMAISSSTQDYRFPQLTKDEVDKIELEISVLSPLERISTIDKIEMGKHGIYIKKGMKSGTYLPQVGSETGWSKEEFLSHCSSEKAGIGRLGWQDKDCELYIYTADVFSEEIVYF